MNSKLETLIQNVTEHTNALKEYVDTHLESSVDFDFVDELNESVDAISEVSHELECRASASEE